MEKKLKVKKDLKKCRKKSSTRTSLSEPELTTGDKSRFNTGFPPGVTVDELYLYRKKKSPAFEQIHDTLKPEEGSFQKIRSEYARRFQEHIHQKDHEPFRSKLCRPEDSLRPEGQLELNPEYHESFIEYPKSIVRRPKNLINALGMEIVDEGDKTDEEQDDPENPTETKPQFPPGRHYLFKRPTNLKLEGDFYSETESAEKFIQYLLTGRPDLARTPTTLKLEGDMETKTETRDKYVPFEYQTRPPLFKKGTNLHLEGILDITTETREKYLPFEVQQRAPLTKRSTNLHLEGDLTLQPEYRDVFVEYKEAERPRPRLPVHNLKPEGCLNTQTEKSEKFVEHQIHPIIPFLRETDPNKKLSLGNDSTVKRAEYREKFVEHAKAERPLQHKPKQNLKPEGNMEVITESKIQFVEKPVSKTEMRKAANNLSLEGNIDMNPEYRNAYVNFYRDAYGKFGVKKDENEPEKRRRRTTSHTTSNLKSEGVMQSSPEYKSSFVDFPRQRPSVKKPAGHLHSEGNVSHVTEKRAQFIEHPKGSKAHPVKRQTELKLEGPFECQPEYRRAYIDYITREKAERLIPLDNLGVDTKRVFDVPDSDPPAILEEKGENASLPAGVGSAALLEAKSTLPLPVVPESLVPDKPARRKTSVSPVPKGSGRRLSKENISKMENCLFGPKVPNPSSRSRNRSRKATPAAETRRISMEDRARALRARRHYGSPVMVENLAYTPRTSPVQAILQASARDRWKHEDNNREGQSFVVLGSLGEEFNEQSKDHVSFKQCDRNHVRYSELYKEQKWMPSWYTNSTSKQ